MPEVIYANQRQRIDPAAIWTSNNPILLLGEIGVESDTRRFKFGDGSTAWNSLSYASGNQVKSVSYSTGSLAAGASEDFAIQAGDYFKLLSYSSSTPSWIRVYGTTAARSSDTRTSPGGTVPSAGAEYYAELVTTSSPQTIRLSPVPLVQATNGSTYLRVKNTDTSTRTISITFSVLVFGI